ncbi:MAG: hypothetical protein ABIQ01_13510 [Pseudolysinimonas sp.]
MEGGAVLERRIDLPRAIVWDALIDPVLVEGWLHPTARPLAGATGERLDPAPGETAVLETVLDPFGHIRFELDERDGGTRGTVTVFRVRCGSLAGWSDRVDDLENLLRGHPVDWTAHPAAERHA